MIETSKNSAIQGIIHLDATTAVTEVSGAPIRDFFHTPSFLDRRLMEVISPFAKPAVEYALERIGTTQQSLLFNAPNGKLFYFLAQKKGDSSLTLTLHAFDVYRATETDWHNNSSRLSLLMKATQSGVYDLDLVNHRVWRNQSFYKLLGYTPSKIDKTDESWWFSVITPEDVDRVKKQVVQIYKKQQSTFNISYKIQGKDEVLFVEDKGYIQYNRDGKPIRVTGIIADLTAQTKAENQLKESEARFKGVFEHAGIGMMRINLIGGILEANTFLADMLGYQPEYLEGKRIFSLIVPASRLQIMQRFKRTVKAKQTYYKEAEVELRHKDGSSIWGKLNISFIWGKSHLPAHGIAMIEDISAQKEAEAKVRESQERIETINNNVDDGIFRSAMEKGVVYANQAFIDMLGYTSFEELQEVATLDLYKDPSQQKYLLEKLAQDGYLRNEEVLLRRKDGSQFWALFNCTFSVKEEGRTYFDGAIVDISEQKTAQELLRAQNEELEKINQELDRFVYSASHDLRAPLTSLLGLLEVIRMNNTNRGLEDYFGMMQQSITKLDLFIREIVNYSRNARTELKSEPIDFEELLSHTFGQLQYIPGAEKIEQKIDIHRKSEFYSDPGRLMPIFSNLISNAFRYHNPTVENPFVHIRVESDDRQAVVTIEDNGLGIKKEHLEHIFEMFYRASEDSKGSGLGLYIVKETLDKLGGTVSVVSKVNKGSTFTLVLPNLKED